MTRVIAPCIFCDRPSSKTGEHVPPRWFQKRWSCEGPFTYEMNGEPIANRRGEPRTAGHLPPMLLPVCDRTTSPNDCNGTLNRLYEVPGKPVVRAVIDSGEVLSSPDQVTDFARWWIKTILLLQHPACRNAFEGVERPAWKLPMSVYEDLIKGTLPFDVSLWIAIFDDVHGSEQLPATMRIYLPTTFNPEGGGGKPATLLTGFRQVGSRVLQLQMAVHPLCDFEHPFEQAGLAARLWPEPPDYLDINDLRILGPEGRRQLGALFVDGGFGVNLPVGGWRDYAEAVLDGGSLGPAVLVPPPMGDPV
jgi:hypothetical protein